MMYFNNRFLRWNKTQNINNKLSASKFIILKYKLWYETQISKVKHLKTILCDEGKNKQKCNMKEFPYNRSAERHAHMGKKIFASVVQPNETKCKLLSVTDASSYMFA